MYEKVVTVFPPNNSHLNPPDSLSLRVSLVDTLYFKTRTQNKASHLKTTDFYKTRQYDTSAYSIFRHERRLKIVRTTALTSYVNLLQVTKKKKTRQYSIRLFINWALQKDEKSFALLHLLRMYAGCSR